MLYPLTLDPPPSSDHSHVVAPGCLLAFTLDLAPGTALDIVATHLARTQDHSLRLWVSRAPGGESVAHDPPSVAFWHPNRTPTEIVRLQDETLPRAVPASLLVPPGRYWLNALNLINSVNHFRLTLTVS